MGTERRRQLLLGAVVVVLALVAYRAWPTTSTGPSSSSNRAGQARAAQNQAPVVTAPAVNLEALNADRAKPESRQRDLFRFRTRALPAPPPAPPRVVQPVVTMPVMPSGPPGPPPIALKFIGLVEATEHKQKIAILSDGRNVPYYGREGDIIEGRYRILKIGVESIDIAYVDGRGRQTIRLTGG